MKGFPGKHQASNMRTEKKKQNVKQRAIYCSPQEVRGITSSVIYSTKAGMEQGRFRQMLTTAKGDFARRINNKSGNREKNGVEKCNAK